MKAFIVRLKQTKDMVGFFVCESEADLAWLVDECVDTIDCEWRLLPTKPGGVYWPQKLFPVPPADGEDMPDFHGPVSVAGSWFDALVDAGEWYDVPAPSLTGKSP